MLENRFTAGERGEGRYPEAIREVCVCMYKLVVPAGCYGGNPLSCLRAHTVCQERNVVGFGVNGVLIILVPY